MKVIYSIAENIILPIGYTVTAKKFYATKPRNYKFRIAKPTLRHDLADKVSNKARVSGRDHFQKSVESNRQPTGSTDSAARQWHGLVYHLNEVYTSIRPCSKHPKDLAMSLATTFNNSLRKNWIARELQPGTPAMKFKEVALQTLKLG